MVDDLNPTGLPQVMDELSGNVVSRTYTYGLQRIAEDQIVNGTWTPSLYGYDGLGNVRQLMNGAGAITDTNEYNAFGNLINFTGTTPNVYLYRGEAYDSDLGLYYLRARYMNPLTGRFMSRDPENGDPVNRVDPTGHQAGVETIQLDFRIDLRSAVAAATVGAAIACAYTFEGTETFAEVKYGIDFGLGRNPSIEGNGPCAVKEQSKETCHEEHPDWPVNYVHYSSTPLIAAHVALALDLGYPDALTYLGPKNPLQKVNRRAACPAGKYTGTGMTCDEYPYASTAQGGAGASTAPVPLSQQLRQGWELQQFYANLGAGQDFCVEVVP